MPQRCRHAGPFHRLPPLRRAEATVDSNRSEERLKSIWLCLVQQSSSLLPVFSEENSFHELSFCCKDRHHSLSQTPKNSFERALTVLPNQRASFPTLRRRYWMKVRFSQRGLGLERLATPPKRHGSMFRPVPMGLNRMTSPLRLSPKKEADWHHRRVVNRQLLETTHRPEGQISIPGFCLFSLRQ